MAYDENTPANSGEDPSASQPKITANFQAIKTVVEINHEAFNDADEGKHKFLQMPDQTSAPATAANEGGLYTKDSTGTNLFFREESSGDELQLTNAFTAAATGNIIIPGGIRLSWGQVTMTTSPSSTVSPTGITNIYSVQFSVTGNVLDNFAHEGVSGNSFRFIRDANTSSTQIEWLVIGV